MNIKIKKLHPDAIVPQYQTAGAACFDFHAINRLARHVDSGFPETFDTGLAFEIPEGHVMLIFSRSGHGFNKDVRLANCVGIIDADYRGEVKVKLTCDKAHDRPMQVQFGDKIAQGIIIPFPRVNFVVADELTDTARGTNGFGSTDKKNGDA